MKSNDGFTYVETLIGISLISLLVLSLIPVLTKNKDRSYVLLKRTREQAEVVRLIDILERDFLGKHWPPWEASPEFIREENHYKFFLADDLIYEIEIEDMGLIVTADKRVIKFRLPTLKEFRLDDADDKYIYLLQIKTAYLDIKTTIRMGSTVIADGQ